MMKQSILLTATLLGGILTCAEHGDVLWGGGRAHAAVYVPGAPGLNCHVSITRAAADDMVEQLVLGRLRRPDAADVLHMPASNRQNADTEAHTTRAVTEQPIDFRSSAFGSSLLDDTRTTAADHVT